MYYQSNQIRCKGMLQTIPEFAMAEHISLDRLRRLLRRDESIRSLCQEIGPTRVIPLERAEEFRVAVRQALAGARA